MAEPGWDLKSEDGLRDAGAEAEKRIDANRLARVTKFLAEVAAVPATERASEEFQQADLVRRTSIRWYVGEHVRVGCRRRRWGTTRNSGRWFADRTNIRAANGLEEAG